MVVQLEWLQREIANTLIHDIEKGHISSQDGEMIAGKVLERIKDVKTEQDLLVFMDELGKLYNGFDNLHKQVHGKLQEHIEKKVANQVLQLVKGGNAKQAIELAKDRME